MTGFFVAFRGRPARGRSHPRITSASVIACRVRLGPTTARLTVPLLYPARQVHF